MGTDIHLYVEVRDPATGKWSLVAPPAAPPESERTEIRKNRDGKEYTYVNPFWGPAGCMYAPGPLEEYEVESPDEYARAVIYRMRWYRNQNYDTFAILTGTVRNGTGFANLDTGDGFYGIVSEPRGMPDNIGDWADFASWDHSEGWLSLEEILTFDWDQVTRQRGIIPLRDSQCRDNYDRPAYETWRKSRGCPENYCGDISGTGILVVSESSAEHLLGEIDGNTRYHVRVQWTRSYRECAADFLTFLHEMVVPLGDPRNVRIVFGFDS